MRQATSADLKFDRWTPGLGEGIAMVPYVASNDSTRVNGPLAILPPPALQDKPAVNSSPVGNGRDSSEESRRRLEIRAHADRLNTVGQMVSGLAHEINAPLATARNYAQACVNYSRSGKLTSEEEFLRLMQNVANQVDRACEIINRLSRFVKRDSASTSQIDINLVIKDVVSWMGPDHCSKSVTKCAIDLKFDLASDLPPISADRVQIEQVLINLVRNAVNAMEERPKQEQHLSIQTREENGFIRVSVEDSGCGIRSEDISKLFDSFVTTKSSGVGLGLSITRSIVEAHGGRIWAESKLGQGTTFVFTLPIMRMAQNHAN